MFKQFTPHTRATFQALFVTFLWSTSWVLIKFGLEDIPALTFAGLRYFLAFLLLLPFFWRSAGATPLRALTRRDWLLLLLLGLVYYTITQGAMFVSLAYVPAIALSLVLNATAVVVAVLGIWLLAERPSWRQWMGTAVFLLGCVIYFYPSEIPTGQMFGYLFALITLVANAFASILGRAVNRHSRLHPLTVTVVSMGLGSILLLAAGLLLEPWPQISWQNWLLIGWLALVNTAWAFTLWNQSLRTLSAMESSIINNTMLIQIAILAWLFLGESLGWIEVIGLALAAIGVLLVQLKGAVRREKVEDGRLEIGD